MTAIAFPSSSARLGFCQRCGDPVSGKARCSRCGGTSQEPKLRSTQLSTSAPKADPWASRYVNGSSGLEDDLDQDTTDINKQSYLTSIPSPPRRSSNGPSMGLGMPSRISRDLRTSFSSRSREKIQALLPSDSSASLAAPSSTNGDGLRSRPVSQDYSAPFVKGADGVLSKLCGSLVEPAESRNRWACAGCNNVFARDSTLYAAPASLQTQDGSYFCRDCYARRYSLGTCMACKKDVLGSTKEDGKYVKASAGLWHGKCWKCTGCGRGELDGVEIIVGMDANPSCEDCFGKPKKRPSHDLTSTANAQLESRPEEIRRLSRAVGAGKGPMGATIAELTKKLGQQTVSSARTIPSSRLDGESSSSTTNLFTSSRSSTDIPRSPSKSTYAFPNHLSTSPGKSGMTRTNSITGSPPKPRPLMAQFSGNLNLAAFKPSFGRAEDSERLNRRDSRSRSVSPAKQSGVSGSISASPSASPDTVYDIAKTSSEGHTSQASSKVPGSPGLPATRSRSNNTLQTYGVTASPLEAGRERTTSGFPRPLNSPLSKNKTPTDPIQGDKSAKDSEPDSSAELELEPADGTTRCAVCRLLPFEGPHATASQEVVMITLAGNISLHAECFKCAICHETIDGSKTFTRLQLPEFRPLVEGLSAYAHPQCAPTIRMQIVREVPVEDSNRGERSFRASLDPDSSRSHATHQRELKPSPVPSPAASMRERESNRQTIIPSSTSSSSTTSSSARSKSSAPVRRFQPTAGAAPPTRSTILTTRPSASGPSNPAAGIFSRMSALSAAANTDLTAASPLEGGRTKFGGMQTCAFCGEKLSSLESVLGPRGTHWHRSCLICRGPPPKPARDSYSYYSKPQLHCGKKLDSGAKVNKNGEVRCRDCYDLESSAFRIKA